MINSQEDNRPDDAPADWSAWPELTYTPGTVATDTDGDGMPDAWETENGLDPNNAADGTETGDNGYTNLENYLNSLVADITEGQLEGGEVMGIDRYVGDDPVATEYELSPITYDYTDENGDWLFTNGFSITPASGDYSTGNDCGISGIKFSRNRDYTINIPNGIEIARLSITGYSNGDGQTSYLSDLGNQSFSNTDYTFPARDSGQNAVTHSITLAEPTTESLRFRVGGDGQVVWIITLYPDTPAGINEVTTEEKPGNGRIYNLQGMEVKEPLAPGIYIRDGKKFIKK